jgi:hypothetical protein
MLGRVRTPLRFVSSILLGATLVGCGPARVEKGPSESEPLRPTVDLTLETRTVERHAADCGDTPEDCGRIALTWTEITDAPAGVAREAINRWVREALLEPPLSEGAPGSPEALADRFIADYEGYRREVPDSPGGWLVERTVEAIHRDEHVVSFRDVDSSFTGGAHPHRTETYSTLYLTTGRPLILEDLLVTGGREELRRIVEARFRRVRGLEPDQDLGKAGFWFGDQTRERTGNRGSARASGKTSFVLPDNFALTDDGLLFHFNPYDIAPYSIGSTTVEVSRSELGDAVQWPG